MIWGEGWGVVRLVLLFGVAAGWEEEGVVEVQKKRQKEEEEEEEEGCSWERLGGEGRRRICVRVGSIVAVVERRGMMMRKMKREGTVGHGYTMGRTTKRIPAGVVQGIPAAAAADNTKWNDDAAAAAT